MSQNYDERYMHIISAVFACNYCDNIYRRQGWSKVLFFFASLGKSSTYDNVFSVCLVIFNYKFKRFFRNMYSGEIINSIFYEKNCKP